MTSSPRCCPASRSRRCWWRSTPDRVHRPPGRTRRQGHPAAGPAAQPAVRDHRRGHQHGPGRDGRVMRRPHMTCWPGRPMVFPRRDAEAANAAIVNYHHRLPMTRAFGTGTLSSSDGSEPRSRASRSPASACPATSPAARRLRLHPRLDQRSTFRHEGYRGDRPGELLRARRHPGQPTRPARHRHADRAPAGATLANFALFDLVDLQPSPRIRDLGDRPVPDRAAGQLHVPLPVRRAPAHPLATRT